MSRRKRVSARRWLARYRIGKLVPLEVVMDSNRLSRKFSKMTAEIGPWDCYFKRTHVTAPR